MPAWFTNTNEHEDEDADADISLSGPLALTWLLIRLLEIIGTGRLPS